MSIDPAPVAATAAAIAHPSQATICLALMDGRAWTATELARTAGIAKSTASDHLTILVSAGLLTEERQGRHRYVRLASGEAAPLIESLGAFSGRIAPIDSLRASSVRDALAQARTCYDHIAGALGVAMFDSLLGNGAITVHDGLTLTSRGQRFIAELAGPEAIDVASRRPLMRTCLDWTERRPHLAGHLGSVLRQLCLDQEWLVAPQAAPRVLRVTEIGVNAFTDTFGLEDVTMAMDRARG